MFNKLNWIFFAVGLAIGLIAGFFTGKGIYDQPWEESVKTDTLIVHDTIPDLNPTPKDSATIKWVTKWLPKHDTVGIDHFIEVNKFVHDTVAVEVPISQKHYGSKEYDAWVSGFEPNLDSIKVYRETQYITTTITKKQPPNKVSLDIVCGIDYNTHSKEYVPHVGGELLYKPNRLSVGVRGGIEKRDKVEPVVGGVVKISIL